MPRITLLPAADPEALAADWQALETRAAASFFQSWTWTGCLAAARFTRPLALRAEQDGELRALALLNQTRARTWLGESGDPAWDAAYIEHNGPLLAQGAEPLLPDCLRALLAGGRILRLSGVDDAHLAAARAVGVVRLRRSHTAPYADLAALGDADGAYLASLSANTRYKLRRSERAYAALGPVTLRRAAALDEALVFLDALAALHQATWTARGKPGAFANPRFRQFHRALLARAVPRGEADLLRISAGPQVIGYLYNFRYRDRVLAYQSGFDYAAPAHAKPGHAKPGHAKPGLTCHHAAIEQARRDGVARYDFLAGDDRYKTSLGHAAVALHWLDVARRWSLAGLAMRAAAQAAKFTAPGLKSAD